MHNLAVLYMEQGNLEKSEQLHVKTLGARQRVQGKSSILVPSVRWMLASVYQCQGKHQKANDLYQQTLALSQKVLRGPSQYVEHHAMPGFQS